MALSALLSHFNSMIIAGLSRSLFVEGIQCLQNPFQTAVPLFLYNKLERCNTQAKLHRPTHSHHYTLKQKFQNENTLGSDRASSKGYIVRWVEAPSNKLLTTAFEASLESVAVTLQAKRRQQDSRDSYGAPKSQSIRGSTPWSGWKTIYALIVMVRFCMPLRCC